MFNSRYKLLQSLFSMGYMSLMGREEAWGVHGFEKQKHVRDAGIEEETKGRGGEEEGEGMMSRLMGIYRNPCFVNVKSQYLF